MARIMFVDDDPFTLETLTRATQIIGHQAILADTAEQALVLAQEQNPDLIFIDMRLPDMDGIDLINRLRSLPATTDIPLLMLSASPEADASQQAILAGAQAFLTKPIRLQVLVETIQQYTQAR